MFYTYLWLREDGTPYYVGKGSGRRAWSSHKGHRPPKERNRILVQEFPSEDDAFVAEKFLIKYYGRFPEGCLRNLTEGGEGVCGIARTDEWRKKQSLSAKKRYQNPEEVKRLSESRRGHLVSTDTRQKLSDWNNKYSPKRGKKLSEETRKKMRQGWVERKEQRKTHCRRGHELSPVNIDSRDRCKSCHNWNRDERRRLSK